jgi:hypothetical protein
MSTEKSYTFKKIVKGVEYICTKKYTTKYEKRGRPKKSEEQSIVDQLAKLNARLAEIKAPLLVLPPIM